MKKDMERLEAVMREENSKVLLAADRIKRIAVCRYGASEEDIDSETLRVTKAKLPNGHGK